MIKQWQSNHEYLCFLNNQKASFDSSERVRLHSELLIPWQKLRLLDTDAAMLFAAFLFKHRKTGLEPAPDPTLFYTVLSSCFHGACIPFPHPVGLTSQE